MATVAELTALSRNYLLNPRPGAGVCRTCFNLTDGYSRCYACGSHPGHLAIVVPISYCVSGGQLHHMLGGYKRRAGRAADWMAVQLAAILWRFLSAHEGCVARGAGVAGFPIVTTVPSSEAGRDEHHPLRRVVGGLCGPSRERHERLLMRTEVDVGERAFDRRKYLVGRELRGEAVLLIDDTWTTGASAESAAAALLEAGAGPVAAVVIGRYLNREWHQNEPRLRALPRPFSWEICALDEPA